jgi:hypothetical protein
MPGLFHSIRRWFASYRAMDQAWIHEKPEPLVGLVKRYPEMADVILRKAWQHHDTGKDRLALVYSTALVLANSRAALDLIRSLLSYIPRHPYHRDPVPSTKLSVPHLQALAAYLITRGRVADVERFYLACSDQQLQTVRPQQNCSLYHPWSRVVLGRRLANTLKEQMKDDEILRAADLLRHHPSLDWIAPLRKLWLGMDERVRQEHAGGPDKIAEVDHGMSSKLELAANAVLAALGACASLDKSFRSFEQDEETSQGLSEAIDHHTRLVEYHNGLVEDYRKRAIDAFGKRTSVDRELSGEIRRVQDELAELSKRITNLRKRREEHSAGFILWCVVRETRRYPTSVRQGAAWGLHFLYHKGLLDETTRARVFIAINQAVSGPANRDFRERRVQLLPGQNQAELAAALHDGLQWVVDLAENNYTRGSVEKNTTMAASPCLSKQALHGMSVPATSSVWAVPSVEELEETVSLLCELMPEALAFLTQYPLRLMPLDDHSHVLGVYTQDGCSVSFWTRYTGEHFSGKVEQRYLRLVDRSTPNSMGIYYRLFRYPLLVLPVLYHEHLHYGGPHGDPERGIANEAEVLLREVLFARGLIARLAQSVPESDVSAFERKLVNQALSEGLEGLLLQWLCDFDNEGELESINAMILATYGDRLFGAQAEEKIRRYFLEQNVEIQRANDTEAAFWCPTIRWPLLEDISSLSAQYSQILSRRWQCRHHLSRKERDSILLEPSSRASQIAWEAYCKRPQACQELVAARTRLALEPEERLRLIVRRISFEPRRNHVPVGVRAIILTSRLQDLLRDFKFLTDTSPLSPEAGLHFCEPLFRPYMELIENGLEEFREVMALAEQEGEIALAGELKSYYDGLESVFQETRKRLLIRLVRDKGEI